MSDAPTAARIAAAAREILLNEGADAVTMRRVAAAAGISPMATYRHYPNRETLVRAVADALFAEVAQGWGKRPHTDLMSRMYGLLDDFLDFALGSPNLYTFLHTDRREDARRFPSDFLSGTSPTFTPLLTLVRQGMGEGLLREDDPLEVTLTLVAHAQGMVQLYLGGRMALSEADFRALCKRTTGRILHGIAGTAQ
ncbi:TetR/AcrR family transcriptional regulator [Allokutzneria oryzae]|uniref:TetR/AcrR family transcriptional regulator n=1 Tax=Allokutzneria oryzae TaxID=1378989 RepID=A0ABV6A3H7_9PSEU